LAVCYFLHQARADRTKCVARVGSDPLSGLGRRIKRLQPIGSRFIRRSAGDIDSDRLQPGLDRSSCLSPSVDQDSPRSPTRSVVPHFHQVLDGRIMGASQQDEKHGKGKTKRKKFTDGAVRVCRIA